MGEGAALCLWASTGRGGAESGETDVIETGGKEGGHVNKTETVRKEAKEGRDEGGVEKGEKERVGNMNHIKKVTASRRGQVWSWLYAYAHWAEMDLELHGAVGTPWFKALIL